MKNELDLHGVKHENVGALLDSFIWDNMKQKSLGVKVITGNSPKMKAIVTEIATEYGYVILDDYCNSAAVLISFI